MQVECVFFGPLREAVGEKTVVHETDTATVGGLLADLETAYPGVSLIADGDLDESVAVTVNGQHVQYLDGFETVLSEGDVVRLTTAVYGGQSSADALLSKCESGTVPSSFQPRSS